MTSSLAQHLRPRRLAALALAALVACGGDATDPTGVPPQPTARVAEVRISPSTIEVALGGTTKLSATPRDANGRPMSGVSIGWRSLDPSVATVDAAGNVTGGALGTARIEASAEGYAGTALVTVRTSTTPATGVATVSIDPGKMSLRPGTTGTLTPVLRNAQNEPVSGTVTWSSENAAVARVSADGIVTAVALGETEIIATVGGRSAFVEIVVADAPPPPAPVARVIVTPNGGSVNVGSELLLGAIAQDAGGARVPSRVVTWTSSSPGIATVSAGGVVRGAAPGTATITARVDNVTASVTVTVTAAPATPTVSTVTISPSPLTLQVGGSQQLTATARDAGGSPVTGASVTWSGGSAAVASVSPSGLVTAHAAGSTTVTATAGGKSASVSVTVTATNGGQTLTLAVTERGTMERDSGGDWPLSTVLFAGDDDENGITVRQAFVVYSLAGLPAGATIESAQLGITMDAIGVIGNPFTLGGLYVERAPTVAITTAAVGAGSVLVANAFSASPTTNVTDLVKAARQAGATSIIFRLRFAQAGNANGATDQVELGAGTLAITYKP